MQALTRAVGLGAVVALLAGVAILAVGAPTVSVVSGVVGAAVPVAMIYLVIQHGGESEGT